MKLNVATMSQPVNLKVNIVLEGREDGGAIASVLEIPSYRLEAATREQALEALQKLLVTQLKNAEIISLEIELTQAEKTENPWIKFAGVFQVDPDFAEIVEEIQAKRNAPDQGEDKKPEIA